MKINKYNEDFNSEPKSYPYELTANGELKKADKEFYNVKYVYLTDEQYNKLKNLANNTKVMCNLLDDKKKLYIDILKGAIQKVKEDSRILTFPPFQRNL